MIWTLEKIRKALGDKLIGTLYMRKEVSRAILYLPEDLIEKVCATMWFISSPEDAWALTFRGSDIREKHLIFLSDELFGQDESQIRYTILHEIGHAVLNHKNSIGFTQTPSEIKEQECEADLFAKQYL